MSQGKKRQDERTQPNPTPDKTTQHKSKTGPKPGKEKARQGKRIDKTKTLFLDGHRLFFNGHCLMQRQDNQSHDTATQ